MTHAKRTIHLTDDNWADYLPTDYAESLVAGIAIGEGCMDRDAPGQAPGVAGA